MEVNLEDFIAIKGIKAIGNQLTSEKIRQVNRLEPLPYTPPVIEEVEVNDEEILDNKSVDKPKTTEVSESPEPIVSDEIPEASDPSIEDEIDGDSNDSEDSSTDDESDGQITLF
jgi:hypothetical protein